MEINPMIQMQTASIQNAVSYAMIRQSMHQDAGTVEMITKMSEDISKMTGLGSKLDISL